MSPEDIYESLLEDPDEARTRLLALAAQGNHEAEFYLGHLADEQSPRDQAGALAWYQKSAAGGFLDARHYVASFMYHGMGTAQDVPGALVMFRQCAEAGQPDSCWRLGNHFLQFPEHRAEAIHWLQRAVELGHLGAVESLAEAGVESVFVRPASAPDMAAIAELFDAYRQFYEQPPDLPLARQFIADRLSQQDSVILVAEAATPGRPLGFCQLYPSFCSVEAQPIYVLYDLFVQPVARQVGVGRQLLLAAEAQAAAEGKVRMDLTTARTNTPAQRLYESLGWVRDDIFLTYNRRLTPP
jgi:ribosomal protein S18 acetylase RimI-like enzyme